MDPDSLPFILFFMIFPVVRVLKDREFYELLYFQAR